MTAAMTAATPNRDSSPPQATPPRQGQGPDPAPRAGTFTGERPGWGEGFDYDFARHLAAYRHAATLVAGRRVLDAGCGEGFGTQTLAATATEIVGIDYSEAAVAESRRLWCSPVRPNLRFEHVDLTHPDTLGERFDVVLSFQVLEHIRDSAAFLRALRDRLAPSGVLVLTTPNRLRTVSENPYHVREYTADELRRELSAVFADVTILGIQGNGKVERFEAGRAKAVGGILALDPFGIRHLLPRRVVEFAFAKLARVVRRRARPAGSEPIVPEDFSVTDAAADSSALDLLAVCRSGERGVSAPVTAGG